MFTKTKCEKEITNLLEKLYPQGVKCWITEADGSDLSDFIVKTFHKANHVISFLGSSNSICSCSAYLIIKKRINRIYNKTQYEKNGCGVNEKATFIKNVVVFYEQIDGTLLDYVSILSESSLSYIYIKVVSQYIVTNLRITNVAKILEVAFAGSVFLNPQINSWIKNKLLENTEYKKWKTTYLNKSIRVGLFNNPPYVIKNQNETFDGVEYRMLIEITKGYKLEIFEVDTSDYKKNPWDHVKTQLYEQNIDIGICSMFMNVYDLSLIEGTIPYTETCLTLLVPRPHLMDYSVYLYLPLTSHVWICCIFSMIFATVAMFYISINANR